MRLDIHAACDRGLLRRDNEERVLGAGRCIRDGILGVELEVRDGDSLFFAVAGGLLVAIRWSRRRSAARTSAAQH